jgi:hypothetical protein
MSDAVQQMSEKDTIQVTCKYQLQIPTQYFYL